MVTPPSYLLDYSSSSSSSESDSDYEFEPVPDPVSVPQIKRQKLSLPPTQVCIVCHYRSSRSEGYDVVVADLDSLRNAASMAHNDEFIPIRTALRLKVDKNSLGFLCFCGLGSKLYIFEPTPHKSVYTIDLSSSYSYSNDLTKPTVVFKRHRLRYKMSDMLHPKKLPFAIPTPDGKKILLFSRLFTYDPTPRKPKPAGANDFELYDPKTDTWQKLPGISHDWQEYYRKSKSCGLNILAFTFIGTSTFFIETTTKLMFTLDLESIDQGWQRMDTFYGAEPASPGSHGHFLVLEDQLCVNPIMAYDINKSQRNPHGFTIPLPPFDDGINSSGAPLVALLDEDTAGKYNFCTLLPGISTTTEIPHVSLNMTSCDLSKYKKDKEEDKDLAELSRSMTAGDSIKFCLDDEKCSDFYPLCFYFIRA